MSLGGFISQCILNIDADPGQAHMKITLLILLLLGTIVSSAQSGLSQDEQRLLRLGNESLAVGHRLVDVRPAAELHAEQHVHRVVAALLRQVHQKMVEHQDISHQFSGEPPLGERIGATGLRFNAAAENVAYAPTVDDIHKGLMNSPPHRANILSPQYNSVGFGIALSQGEIYVTQNFANVVPSYTEAGFRDAIIANFNKARRAHHLREVEAHPDPLLNKAACTANVNPNHLIHDLPGVTALVVFTSSVPDNLPSNMQTAAGDASYRRMNIGVCFKPGPSNGFGSFYVVAAFYPAT